MIAFMRQSMRGAEQTRMGATLGCLLLAACGGNGWDWKAADKRYQMMLVNEASNEDLCAEAKRNARAALNALDDQEYERWEQFEKEDCRAAGVAATS